MSTGIPLRLYYKKEEHSWYAEYGEDKQIFGPFKSVGMALGYIQDNFPQNVGNMRIGVETPHDYNPF